MSNTDITPIKGDIRVTEDNLAYFGSMLAQEEYSEHEQKTIPGTKK